MRNALLPVLALFGASVCFGAEVYPSKTVRVIVPYGPAGSVDLVARLFADDLTKAWRQQVVVDNRLGASGIIGTELAKAAAPDGYTLLVNTLPFVTNQFAYGKSEVRYDPITDFAPISVVSSIDALLVVHPSLPVRTVGELVALAKSKPGELNYATLGPGTNPHICSELLNLLGKINITAVPYKLTGTALASTISGENQVFFSMTISDVLPLVQAKRLRALGVGGLKRSPIAPQIPTLAESGLPGFEFTSWHVFVAPAATPRALIKQINDTMRSSLRRPETVQKWRERGVELVVTTPDEAAAHLKKEVLKWRVVFKERGIKVR